MIKMFDFPPTQKELTEDAKRDCPKCGRKMESTPNTTDFWGVKATHLEYACECGYEEMPWATLYKVISI